MLSTGYREFLKEYKAEATATVVIKSERIIKNTKEFLKKNFFKIFITFWAVYGLAKFLYDIGITWID